MPLISLNLDSDSGAALLSALASRGGEAMVRAARLPTRLFTIRSALAPGLHCIGGEVNARSVGTSNSWVAGFSATGSGERPEDALASCVGEAVERLSQVERLGDVVRECSYDQALHYITPSVAGLVEALAGPSGQPRSEPVAWVRGHRLAAKGEVLLPADWCLRRQARGLLSVPGAALSTGCAAGPTFEAAAARALLELVERDAAALWWIGGLRPRPVAAGATAMAEAVRLLLELRQGESQRATWLLDITTDLEIPCMAAVSVDTAGCSFSCGLAARIAPAAAARSAILEMCQMELAVPIVEEKRRERGDGGLNEADRKHLARAARINAGNSLLHPLGVPRLDVPEADTSPNGEFVAIGTAFARCGIDAALVDLTRSEVAIPVVLAVAPELQLLPADWTTARLRRVREATGGGEGLTGGLALL